MRPLAVDAAPRRSRGSASRARDMSDGKLASGVTPLPKYKLVFLGVRARARCAGKERVSDDDADDRWVRASRVD